MKSNLLMNCLWHEDISPEELAERLELSPEVLFRKIFQEEEFTLHEINQIVGLLGLTEEEANTIFFRRRRERWQFLKPLGRMRKVRK